MFELGKLHKMAKLNVVDDNNLTKFKNKYALFCHLEEGNRIIHAARKNYVPSKIKLPSCPQLVIVS